MACDGLAVGGQLGNAPKLIFRSCERLITGTARSMSNRGGRRDGQENSRGCKLLRIYQKMKENIRERKEKKRFRRAGKELFTNCYLYFHN